MKKRILYATVVAFVLFAILLISVIFIKFHYCQLCAVASSDGSYTLLVDKNINRYIKNHNVQKVNGEIDNRKYYFKIYFHSTYEDGYLYWLNPTSASFYLDQGTYNYTFDFGEINFISYLFKNII